MASPDNFDTLSKLQPGPNIADSLGQGLDVGMKLATMKDTVEQKKIQTQQLQEELHTKKFEALAKMTKTYLRSGDKVRKMIQKPMEESLRRNDINPQPGFFDAIASDSTISAGMQNAFDLYNGGQLTPDQMQSIVSSDLVDLPDVLSQLGVNSKLAQQKEIAETKLVAEKEKGATQTAVQNENLQLKKDAEDRRVKAQKKKDLYGAKEEFDRLMKDDVKRLGQSKNVLGLIKTNTPIGDEGVKTAFMRLTGEVGAMTDNDIKRAGGSQDLINRATTLFKRASEGTMTEKDRANLIQVTQEFVKVLDHKVLSERDRIAKSRAQAMDLDEEEVKQVINAESVLNAGDTSQSSKIDVGGGKFVDTTKGTKSQFQKFYPNVQITPEMKFKPE